MKELIELYEEYLDLMAGEEPTFAEFMNFVRRNYYE